MIYISYTLGKVISMNFEVEFYETVDGKTPVDDFLGDLDPKMRAKMVGMMELLEEKGTSLRAPYTKYLRDDIFELRCNFGNNITRALFFFYTGGKIIITNGFVKKKDKTPDSEIEMAIKRRQDYITRKGDRHEDIKRI